MKHRKHYRLFLLFMMLFPACIHAQQNTGCTRSVPEPVIKKDQLYNHSFKLSPDSLSATESVKFENGDKLVIKHQGCEYFVITFQFETRKFQHNIADTNFWFMASATLMKSIKPVLNAPINIAKGIKKLQQVAREEPRPVFKKLYNYDGNIIRDEVSVDPVNKMKSGKYAVTITFATGPL